MTWLLKLYPRAWRRRFGAEFEELLGSQPGSMRVVVDLLGGAIDAHLNPQRVPRQGDGAAAIDTGETRMIGRMKRCCATASVSRKDALISAGLTIGTALGVAAIMVVGRGPTTETIGLVMFPGVLAVGTIWLQSRGHSMTARLALTFGPLLILFLIGLAAGIVQGM